MIQLVSDDPLRTALFDEPEPGTLLRFRYWVQVGNRWFVSPFKSLRSTGNNDLLDAVRQRQLAIDRWHQLELEIFSRLRYGFRLEDYRPGREISREFSQSDQLELRKLQIAYGEVQSAGARVVILLLATDSDFARLSPLQSWDSTTDTRSYIHRNGRVWSSSRTFSEDEWIALTDRKLQKDQEELERNLRPATTSQLVMRLITTEVRREVWRRDNGRCVTCGSQERLEFDHVIPVAMGGSSTARNIQLLCEQCNRQKGATLG